MAPATADAVLGGTTTFKCSSSGNGTLKLMWRTPAGKIVITGQETLSLSEVSSNISLSNITEVDGGNYTCIAVNEAGLTEASATLRVGVFVANESLELFTAYGHVVILTCTVQIAPNYKWEKFNESELEESSSASGIMIMSSDGYQVVSNEQELQLDPVQFGQEGVYRCVANTTMGEVISNKITITSEYCMLYFSSKVLVYS